jgi:hypothetical protein
MAILTGSLANSVNASVSIGISSHYHFGAYATVWEADGYFGARLFSDVWTSAILLHKRQALRQATLMIDRLNFYGDKYDADQQFEFPRDDDDEFPQDIKNACCELAFALLDGVDPDLEFESLTMRSVRVDKVSSVLDPEIPQEHIVAGIPSIRAWRFLKPYLRDIRTFLIERSN